MFNEGDAVIYGMNGVCRIQSIETRDFGGEEKEYYILTPLSDENCTIFVPVEGEIAAKIKCILTSTEIHELIAGVADEESIWIEEDEPRRVRFKAILAGGDRGELFALIKTLFIRAKNLESQGKKMHMADDQFLRNAEKILYGEIAHVMGISEEEVLPFIMGELGEEA